MEGCAWVGSFVMDTKGSRGNRNRRMRPFPGAAYYSLNVGAADRLLPRFFLNPMDSRTRAVGLPVRYPGTKAVGLVLVNGPVTSSSS